MNKKKIKEIIAFSSLSYFKSKGFIIFNILSLIIMIFSTNWGTISKKLNIDFDDEYYELQILTNNDEFFNKLDTAFAENERLDVTRVEENNYTDETIKDKLLVLELYTNPEKAFDAKLTSKEAIPTYIYKYIEEELASIREGFILSKYSLSDEELAFMQSDIEIERVMLGVDSENYEEKELLKMIATFISYMAIIILFSKIATEIAQEKQSKSSEYILTTVSGKEYLLAKVAGNSLFALAQLMLFFAYTMISLSILSILNMGNVAIPEASIENSEALFSTISFTNDILPFVATLLIFNLLSIAFLSIIQATLASKSNSVAESSSTTSIILVLTVACYIASNTLIDPFSTISLPIHLLSMLPVISAYFLPGIMIIGQSNVLEIIIALIINILAVPIAFNLCHERFKNGLLDYTKRKASTKKEMSLEEKQTAFINKRTFSSIGMKIGLCVLTYTSLFVLLSLILPPIFNSLIENQNTSLFVIQMLSQIISLGVAYIVARSFTSVKKQEEATEEDKRTFKPNFLQIVLIVFSVIFIFNLIISDLIYPKLGLDYNVIEVFDITSNTPVLDKLIYLIALAIVPGIFEELFFRKALIDLLKKYGPTFAIVMSALIFGFAHMNLPQFIFAFLMGLIFGKAYLKTNNIKITMLVHILNNSMACVGLFLPSGEFEPVLFGVSSTAELIYIVVLFVILIVGIINLIRYFVSNKIYENIKNSLKKDKNKPNQFVEKYRYLFCDLTFDVSIILLIVLSVVNDTLLKNMLS